MDPAAGQQQYDNWQQYYGDQRGQPQQGGPPQMPPNPDAGGYNAYFDKSGSGGTGQWEAPPSYGDNQPSYNSVPPPRRGGFGGGQSRDRPQGGYGGGQSNYSGGGGGDAPAANKIVFVSGLPQHANEAFIQDVFSNGGTIEVDEYSGKPKIKVYKDRGVSKGECTISFEDEASALRVIASMNGQLFPGTNNVMSVSLAQFSGGGGRSSRGGGGSYGDRGGRGGGFRGGYGDRGRESGGGYERQYDSRNSGGRDFGRDREGGGFRGRGGDRGGGGFRGRGGGGFDRDRQFGSRDGNHEFGRDGGGFRGGRGGDRGFGSRDGGDRGGGFRGAPRGGRGAGNANVREGDWMCECGNNNFAFRRECNQCKAPRADNAGGGGGGQMRGPPRNSDSRHRPY